MNDHPTQKTIKDLPVTMLKQMATLSTSGLGLVAALAWNEVVKASIETYIKPYLGVGSGILSQLIYAIVITILAVIVTFQFTIIQQRMTRKSS